MSWDGSEGWLSRTLIASTSARRTILPGPAVAPDAVAPGCDPADANCMAGYNQGYDSSYADNGLRLRLIAPLDIGIGIDGGYYGGGYYGRGYGADPPTAAGCPRTPASLVLAERLSFTPTAQLSQQRHGRAMGTPRGAP